jgi:hypothetical protein
MVEAGLAGPLRIEALVDRSPASAMWTVNIRPATAGDLSRSRVAYSAQYEDCSHFGTEVLHSEDG